MVLRGIKFGIGGQFGTVFLLVQQRKSFGGNGG